MKTVEIQDCGECPNLTMVIYAGWKCKLTDETILGQLDCFPDWCPLPNAEGESGGSGDG